MKNKILFFVLLSAVILMSFSIFSTNDGYPRKYRVSDLPFVFRVNEHVQDHAGWYEAIVDGAEQWTEVPSAYMEFNPGEYTSANSRVQDGINLVYFDDQYDNFEEGGNVIAFSSTFTTGSGATYHAVESDLIWNAAGFPPGINGEPDQQDLQSVIAHEFGHHLGLGHCGDDGNDQPGAGDVINDAVMYWAGYDGDTSNRHLHIDDIMGLTAIYPRIKFTGVVQNDVGVPIGDAFINVSGTTSAYVDDPIPIWGYQMGGYVTGDTIPVKDDGTFTLYTTTYNFDLTFFAFGYESEAINISLGETSTDIDLEHPVNGGIVTLNPLSTYGVNFTVEEQAGATPVNGEIKFYSHDDPSGNPYVISDITDGTMNAQLPLGHYALVIIADIPHEYKEIDDFEVTGDMTETIYLRKGQILLLDNDFQVNMNEALNFESYYITALKNMESQTPFTYHDIYEKGFEPNQTVLNDYDAVILFTGSKTSPVFASTFTDYLAGYLDNGGNLFFTGQGALIFNTSNSFFPDYLKVSYASTGPVVNKNLYIPTGNPISGDWMFMQYNGAAGADNQNLVDVLNLHDEGANPCFYYHPQNDQKVAGMYYTDATLGYKVVYLGFGMEALVNLLNPSAGDETRAQFVQNVMDYFGVVVGIEDEDTGIEVVKSFKLEQNYPNPFNPSTTINYQLPNASDVELSIYNALGQKVRTLLNAYKQPGVYQVNWDGTNSMGVQVPSGVYFYQIKVGEFLQMRKMLLMK